MKSGDGTQSSCPTVWLTTFMKCMFSNNYIVGHWISNSGQVAELLTQGRTQDPVGCVDGCGVRCGGEWWSAGVASVEAGHGRKTGVDFWRDWVCGVILKEIKKKKSSDLSHKCICIEIKSFFILSTLNSPPTSPRLCGITKVTGRKDGAWRQNKAVDNLPSPSYGLTYHLLSGAAYQTVVWVQVAVVSCLWHVRRSGEHSPVARLADPIGRVPRVRWTVGTI